MTDTQADHELYEFVISAHAAYPDVPRITTLHGTELKLIDAMQQRIRLARRTLHTDNPDQSTEALRLAGRPLPPARTAELGVDKPSPLAYQRAAERMGIPPEALGYFDDEPTFVHAARSLGLQAHLFTGPARLAADLRSFGVHVEVG
ncbi:hypothetical protein ACFWMJ_36425 [Streptomyces hawaiiensis]|uniref:hypothetical protein n=1 Tax=Streptomyces hawaiiensis TaxID=67305 RepID=UPI003666F3DD